MEGSRALWLEYGDPRLSGLNLQLTGAWRDGALHLTTTKNPFPPMADCWPAGRWAIASLLTPMIISRPVSLTERDRGAKSSRRPVSASGPNVAARASCRGGALARGRCRATAPARTRFGYLGLAAQGALSSMSSVFPALLGPPLNVPAKAIGSPCAPEEHMWRRANPR